MKLITVRLHDICEIQNGFAFDSARFSEKEGMPLVRIRDLRRSVCSYRFNGDFDQAYVVRSGDILVGMDGEFNVFEWKGDNALLNQRVCRLIPRPGQLHPTYLLHRIKSDLQHIEDKTASTTVKHLSSKLLGELEWNIPEFEEQRRIAAHLKSQLAAVEEARNAAQAQSSELTNLANAIVRESLDHPDVETHTLGDVLDEVKRGIGSSWADYPVLGATRAGLAPAKEPVGKNPARYKPVLAGTVFYNPMRILIGSIAMVDDDDTPGITSPDYVALRGREGVVDSRWFYYWLRSPTGEHCIVSLARGAVRERMLFNRLAEGAIELPPYSVQQAASRALAEIRPMKNKIETQFNEIELLPARLLAKAFEGNA